MFTFARLGSLVALESPRPTVPACNLCTISSMPPAIIVGNIADLRASLVASCPGAALGQWLGKFGRISSQCTYRGGSGTLYAGYLHRWNVMSSEVIAVGTGSIFGVPQPYWRLRIIGRCNNVLPDRALWSGRCTSGTSGVGTYTRDDSLATFPYPANYTPIPTLTLNTSTA